jgi:hypothetical protein
MERMCYPYKVAPHIRELERVRNIKLRMATRKFVKDGGSVFTTSRYHAVEKPKDNKPTILCGYDGYVIEMRNV